MQHVLLSPGIAPQPIGIRHPTAHQSVHVEIKQCLTQTGAITTSAETGSAPVAPVTVEGASDECGNFLMFTWNSAEQYNENSCYIGTSRPKSRSSANDQELEQLHHPGHDTFQIL